MTVDFSQMPASCILPGDTSRGFRDPAVFFYEDVFYCYYSYVTPAPDGFTDFRLGVSTSRDLIHWSEPMLFTQLDRTKNYSSPGCILAHNGEFVMCMQTYPTDGNAPGKVFGNQNSRIYLMRSHDLIHWSEPELMRVHGDGVSFEQMGRMIDPYILPDHDDPQRYFVFYKQPPRDAVPRRTPSGYPVEYMSYSSTRDLIHFTYEGAIECGENVCVLFHNNEYRIYHSPQNGIGCIHTRDFRTCTQDEPLTLGQAHWAWARDRVTAGFVLDATLIPGVGKYLLFFNGDRNDAFPFCASIGLAWSDDLANWNYVE